MKKLTFILTILMITNFGYSQDKNEKDPLFANGKAALLYTLDNKLIDERFDIGKMFKLDTGSYYVMKYYKEKQPERFDLEITCDSIRKKNYKVSKKYQP